jgi:serine/threonine protein kinase
MGEVHEAEDRLLDKVVALKTLNGRLIGDPRAMAGLKSEVAMAHQVTHPNICRIFDLGIDQGNGAGPLLFLTMECLSGETLAAFLGRRGPLDPEEALPLLTQIAAGLAAAHAAGVIHRDLKGENVMLVPRADSPPRAVITDFGLAGSAMPGELSKRSGVGFNGTLAYAAPERLAGVRATAASDVYSFGLLALEVLTGSLGTEPSAANRSPSPAWAHLIDRATRPRPADRLPDGAALLAALGRLAAPPRRLAGWTRPTLVVGAAAGVALMAMIAWTSRQHRQAQAALPPVAAAAPLARSAPVPPPALPSRVSNLPSPSNDLLPKADSTPMPPVASRPRSAARPARPRSPLPAGGGGAAARPAPPVAAMPTSASTPAVPVPEKTTDDIVRELPAGRAEKAPPVTVGADLVNPFGAGSPKPVGAQR